MTVKRELACAAIGAFACMLAAGPPARAAGGTYYGTFDFEITLTLSPEIPNGTTIAAMISVGAYDSTGSLHDANSTQVEVSATAANGKATFSVPVAYGWILSTHPKLCSGYISVSAEIDQGNESIDPSTFLFFQQDLPHNGATTTVKIVNSL